jgi:outer membrane protein assembly factor BamB
VEDRAFVAGCDGKLHIIDLKTGSASATVEIGSPTGVTPAVLGDLVYFGTEGGTLLCIDWRKAEVKWSYDEPRRQAFRSSPAVEDGLVVVGSPSKPVYTNGTGISMAVTCLPAIWCTV